MNLNPFRKLSLGYDAAEDSGRRRRRKVDNRSEDKVLKDKDRKIVVSETRDQVRNNPTALWMVNRHLDYVTTYSFEPRSGNAEFDARLSSLIDWWQRPQNFDVAGRHGLTEFVRLSERCAVNDGDVFVGKIAATQGASNRGKVQAIEGDRVRTPNRNLPRGFDGSDFVHGVKVSPAGKAQQYSICNRIGNGYELHRTLPALHVYHHGFFSRFDQVRGVSPILAALNTLSDGYEFAEFARAKAKVGQLFGLKFTRDGGEEFDLDGDSDNGYSFNFGSGPQVLDLDPGDDAQFIESRSPAEPTQKYMQEMLAAGLKALDIPYSFYNESFTNYSGARQALLQYEQSASTRRKVVQRMLNHLTAWRIALWIEDGILELPEGETIGSLNWEWMPSGLPWIDPLKETKADALAVEAKLTSRQRIARRRGEDWRDIAAELAQEEEVLRGMEIEGDSNTSLSALAFDAEELKDELLEELGDKRNE